MVYLSGNISHWNNTFNDIYRAMDPLNSGYSIGSVAAFTINAKGLV
jgi:hypothetical protein